jgi:hypothetical protein
LAHDAAVVDRRSQLAHDGKAIRNITTLSMRLKIMFGSR